MCTLFFMYSNQSSGPVGSSSLHSHLLPSMFAFIYNHSSVHVLNNDTGLIPKTELSRTDKPLVIALSIKSNIKDLLHVSLKISRRKQRTHSLRSSFFNIIIHANFCFLFCTLFLSINWKGQPIYPNCRLLKRKIKCAIIIWRGIIMYLSFAFLIGCLCLHVNGSRQVHTCILFTFGSSISENNLTRYTCNHFNQNKQIIWCLTRYLLPDLD